MFTAEVDGRFAGYVCVGPTPLTHSTWHLYWICVHPRAQGRGVGRALQAHAEAFVRSRGGERIVLETSASAAYARARLLRARPATRRSDASPTTTVPVTTVSCTAARGRRRAMTP